MRDEFPSACDLQRIEVDCLGSAEVMRGGIVRGIFLRDQIKHKIARIESHDRFIIAAWVRCEFRCGSVVKDFHFL
jgi:hypothetical protein